MSPWVDRLDRLRFDHRSVPWLLLFLCLVAYGLNTPWVGFYWDDWPWMWLSHLFGPQKLAEIDFHRPLGSLFLAFGGYLLGESYFAWQVFNLVIRWLGALAFWWAMRKIWPQHDEKVTWLALLFAIYPGFTQQYVSVNTSRHLYPLALFFLSLGTMVSALKRQRGYWLLTAAGLGLSLLTAFSTEYYYGLELVRPAILWIILAEDHKKLHLLIRRVVWHWSPYLIALLGVYAWRYYISRFGNYAIEVFEHLNTNPFAALYQYLQTMVEDLVETSAGAWLRVFSFPTPSFSGPRVVAIYWVLVLAFSIGVFLYLSRFYRDQDTRAWWKQAVVMGVLSLLVGGLPFLVTDLEISLDFPADRATLPMMLGASLLFAGLLESLRGARVAKIALLSLAIGLAVGAHFRLGLSYRRDWIRQEDFFRQLTHRIPGLEPDTVLLTEEIPIQYSSDSSMAALLNWAYQPGGIPNRMDYNLMYIGLRLGNSLPSLQPHTPILKGSRFLDFHGSTDQAIVFLYDPPACLRVLDPQIDGLSPGLPALIVQALPLSDLNRIQLDADPPARLPLALYGPDPPPNWCYYFQRADLARQAGDWGQVTDLGDTAYQLYASPQHPAEHIPFIEGYAHLERWDRAQELTFAAANADRAINPMLCALWERIAMQTTSTPQRANAFSNVAVRLSCPLP